MENLRRIRTQTKSQAQGDLKCRKKGKAKKCLLFFSFLDLEKFRFFYCALECFELVKIICHQPCSTCIFFLPSETPFFYYSIVLSCSSPIIIKTVRVGDSFTYSLAAIQCMWHKIRLYSGSIKKKKNKRMNEIKDMFQIKKGEPKSLKITQMEFLSWAFWKCKSYFLGKRGGGMYWDWNSFVGFEDGSISSSISSSSSWEGTFLCWGYCKSAN